MHPIELDAILKLAKNHLRSGQVAEAEIMYHKVLNANPHCAEALHFLGLAAMQRAKLDEALDLVQKSIELEELNPEFHNNLATVLGQMNRGPEALGAAQRAIDLKDDSGLRRMSINVHVPFSSFVRNWIWRANVSLDPTGQDYSINSTSAPASTGQIVVAEPTWSASTPGDLPAWIPG